MTNPWKNGVRVMLEPWPCALGIIFQRVPKSMQVPLKV